MGVSLFCNMSNWNLANRQNDNIGQEHYDAIRSDSNSENWAFFAYDYPTKTLVTLTGSGSGDINEFFDYVKGQNGGYGFCRVETGDEESRRTKFFLAAWVPESGPNKLPIMVKGNMSVTKLPSRKSSEISTLNSLSPPKLIWMLKQLSTPLSRLEVPTTWDNKDKFLVTV